ncbi:hypothetical protein DVH24_004863 [Malus domestica]|uniref:Uncharacterized protein n=1 Tax=Malus domestica TaxID=3750 RepID=A0A498ID67_MALDO|nr:hypothetical protein DVH24_004863 [Malus domestica]
MWSIVENNAVEASTLDIDYEVVASKIEADGWNEIMNFRTIRIRGQYKVCHTIPSVFPPIPRHQFFLHDFNTFYPRLKRVEILTRWQKISAFVSHLFCAQKTRVARYVMGKCCINFLFFIGGDVVFADCCCVYKFKSQIRREDRFEQYWVFAHPRNFQPVKILPPSSRQVNEAELIARRVTIDKLAFLDPDLHKDDTFVCKASVKRFDTAVAALHTQYLILFLNPQQHADTNS